MCPLPVLSRQSGLRASLNEGTKGGGGFVQFMLLPPSPLSSLPQGVIRKSASPLLSHFISPDYRPQDLGRETLGLVTELSAIMSSQQVEPMSSCKDGYELSVSGNPK